MAQEMECLTQAQRCAAFLALIAGIMEIGGLLL